MSRLVQQLLILSSLLILAARTVEAVQTVVLPTPVEPPVSGVGPAIHIVPRLDAAERARRAQAEGERLAGLRPAVELWCRGYVPAVRPLRAAVDEAWDSLQRGWGPGSRHLGYPITLALAAVGGLPILPDPLLERQLRQVLQAFVEATRACTTGPLTAWSRLTEGRKRLADFEQSLARYAVAGGACPPASRRAAEPETASGSTVEWLPGGAVTYTRESEGWDAGAKAIAQEVPPPAAGREERARYPEEGGGGKAPKGKGSRGGKGGGKPPKGAVAKPKVRQ